jgi:hypothetical protein
MSPHFGKLRYHFHKSIVRRTSPWSSPIPFWVAMDTARLVWQGGVPMMRQLVCRGLILGAIFTSSAGCETLHHMLRPHDNDDAAKKDDNDDKDDPAKPKAVESDTSKIKSVNSDDNSSEPFFAKKYSRSSWSNFSPEAQQIEKDLGVY